LDELAKLANGQVFDQMKATNASKFTNLELTGLEKANVNALNQPMANAKIWAQNDATLDYLDKFYQAHLGYRMANPDNAFPERFDNAWRLKPENDLNKLVADKNKDIAPLGMPIPSKLSELVDGKAYNFPPDPNRSKMKEGGKYYWDTKVKNLDQNGNWDGTYSQNFVKEKPVRD
jgi:hypothetical protein